MVQKEIETITINIGKKLWKEIKYARDNLNRQEKKKKQGVRRMKHTILSASQSLGEHLNSLRAKSK